MIAIICVDNSGGILFNNRRISRDSVLTQWIIEHTAGRTLWMRQYSKELFGNAANANVSEDYLEKAKPGEYCFVEDGMSGLYKDNLEAMIICKWNRDYPSDTKFPENLKGEEWKISVVDEFRGSSHDKITIEKWCK